MSGSGIIERNDDFDLFSFVTEDSEASFDFSPFSGRCQPGHRRGAAGRGGTLIVSSNPIGSLAANLTATLAAGQYLRAGDRCWRGRSGVRRLQ